MDKDDHNSNNVPFDRIYNLVIKNGTDHLGWNRVMNIFFCDIVAGLPNKKSQSDAVGCFIHVCRQEAIEGRKRFVRKYHVDPFVERVAECGINMSDFENIIRDSEDPDQKQLAPKSYSLFTGMFIAKMLNIPELTCK